MRRDPGPGPGLNSAREAREARSPLNPLLRAYGLRDQRQMDRVGNRRSSPWRRGGMGKAGKIMVAPR